MFKIDLLKGENIPPKNRPVLVGLLTSAFIFPFVLILVLFCWYLSWQGEIRASRISMANYERKITEFSDTQKQLENVASQTQYINVCLHEVSQTITDHTQWSPVLSEIAQKLPNTLTINKLLGKRNEIHGKGHKKDKWQYILQIGINGDYGQNTDDATLEFIKQLRNSEVLKNKIENIQLVSQQLQSVENRSYTHYEIDCLLKEKI